MHMQHCETKPFMYSTLISRAFQLFHAFSISCMTMTQRLIVQQKQSLWKGFPNTASLKTTRSSQLYEYPIRTSIQHKKGHNIRNIDSFYFSMISLCLVLYFESQVNHHSNKGLEWFPLDLLVWRGH